MAAWCCKGSVLGRKPEHETLCFSVHRGCRRRWKVPRMCGGCGCGRFIVFFCRSVTVASSCFGCACVCVVIGCFGICACRSHWSGCVKVAWCSGCMLLGAAAACVILLSFAAEDCKSYWSGCIQAAIVICQQIFPILALIIFLLKFLLKSASKSSFFRFGVEIRFWSCNFRRHCT